MRKLLIILLIGSLSACSSVTLRTDHQKESSAAPTYQKRFHYWFWGLKGEYSVNVREICAGRPVIQMQSVDTFVDILGQVFTLGIYYPRSARVWCAERSEGNQ
ncbi:Bor family protein [Litoribacillus peritrichatus]|uniref:Bor family protein n=1 Tax=Litoribacillus peritrichatus TaxID=718191 RepID=A0ABP7N8I5_9GAMM